jgi:anti-anti-sigma factor
MVPLPFAMWVGEHEGVLAVRLAGRLESPWADEVRRELLWHAPSVLRLDVAGLTAIDPFGLAALVAIRHDVVSGGGRFVLRGVSGAVRASLAAAGLEALVEDERIEVATAPRPMVPLGQLPAKPVKGGRDARRAAAIAPKVA